MVDLQLPFLQRLGLGNIIPILGVPPGREPLALTGRLATLSAGKDTTVGHWEHMGLVTARPFPTYPNGFPEEVLAPFRERIGRGVLGNKPASGTAIIDELGEAHLATGQPDRLHVGRQRLPDSRSRRRGASGAALRMVRDSPRRSCRGPTPSPG